MFEAWMTLLFVYLAVVLPWSTTRRMGMLAARPNHPGVRPWQLDLYPRIVGAQWILAGVVVAGMWRLGVPPAWIGLRLPDVGPVTVGAVAAVLALAWLAWDWRLRRAVREPARRARFLARFARIRMMLPATDEMFRWWIAVSITAGVCEETLYRGFMGFYLHQWMPMWAAALVGSALFGAAHLYQGARGAARTAVVGALLWAVYMVTGSLLLPMLLHALIDVRSGLALKLALALEVTADGA